MFKNKKIIYALLVIAVLVVIVEAIFKLNKPNSSLADNAYGQIISKETLVSHLKISKSEISVGEIFDAELTLANLNLAKADLSNGPIKNIKISISASPNLQLLDKAEKFLAVLKFEERKKFSWKIKAKREGSKIEQEYKERILVTVITENAGSETREETILVKITNMADCELIQDFDKKVRCYELLLGEPTVENCNKIANLEIRDRCLSSINFGAVGDPKLCLQISDLSKKDQCFSAFAHQLKDYNPCFSISNEAKEEETGHNLKNSCLRDIAVMTDNVNICSKIELPYYRDWCYLDLATILKDQNLCNKIESEETKILCYQEARKNQ